MKDKHIIFRVIILIILGILWVYYFSCINLMVDVGSNGYLVGGGF